MSAERPFLVARATVVEVERISPSFARIAFGGPAVADFGTPGEVLDQRIKLIFPPNGGPLPELRDDLDWYSAWLELPDDERGTMRTYSIRELRVEGAQTVVVIDFVLHLEPGLTGPAASWAVAAQPGDELILIGPRRGRTDGGGIEFAPGDARTVLLAGDETAAPAIARILEDLGPDARGVAFVEVPLADDALAIGAAASVDVRWLPRNGAAHGEALIPAVLAHLGVGAPTTGPIRIRDVESEDLLWETPQFSGLGEALEPSGSLHENYYWIAGESGVVTTLRRRLVKDLGVDRAQVAFMGYWRKGVAMRG